MPLFGKLVTGGFFILYVETRYGYLVNGQLLLYLLELKKHQLFGVSEHGFDILNCQPNVF